MIHVIPDLLTAEQVAVLRRFADSREFIDGRATNVQSSVKNNQQIDQQDAEVEKAGAAVIYPTGVIHQVRPVTRGTRLVAVTWIQSLIPNPQHRQVLFHHLELMSRLQSKCDEGDKLMMESVRTQLMRLWADI